MGIFVKSVQGNHRWSKQRTNIIMLVLSAGVGCNTPPSPPTQTSQPPPSAPSQRAPTATTRGTPRVQAESGPSVRRVFPVGIDAIQRSVFDGDRSTAITTGTTLRLEFQRPIRLRALALFGEQQASLSVVAGQEGATNGGETDVAGLHNAPVRSRSGEWTRMPTGQPIEAKVFRVRWEPTGPNARLEELEFWAESSPHAHVPGTTLAEDVRGELANSGRIVLGAQPQQWTVNAANVQEQHQAGEFRFSFAPGQSASRCVRAFVEYDLEGMEHWSNLSRSINDLPELPGIRQHRVGIGGHQVEELAPNTLRDGDNTIRFLPIAPTPGNANVLGYSVRNVRVTCATDYAQIEDDAPLSEQARSAVLAVTDGNDQTAINVVPNRGTAARSENGTGWWSFGSPTQLHQALIKVPANTMGTLLITAADDGSAAPSSVSIALRALTDGWNTLEVPRGLRVAERYRVELRAAGESPVAISELDLIGSPQPNGVRAPLVLTYPLHSECSDGVVYVRGFVPRSQAIAAATSTGQSAATTTVLLSINGGRETPLQVLSSGEFAGEIAVHSPSAAGASAAHGLRPSMVTIAATLADGRSLERSFEVSRCENAPPARNPLTATIPDVGAPYSAVVRPNEARTLVFAGTRLEIPVGAVTQETRITVRPLMAREIPPLDPGMTNVTPRGEGFRFGPHRTHFARDVKLSIPFDRARLPESMRQGDVFAFYFDEAEHRWRKVDRLAVSQGELIASATDHFTDYIAGTLSAPETPQAASFDGNTIQGIQAANPTAGLTMIAPPQANSMGTASTSFPIAVPPGRNGMQPSIGITYGSEQDNGWMGVGWNLRLPSIEIDTRFGVPEYTGNETYLLDGAQLVAAPDDPHNDAGNHVAVYRRRIEGAFERIIRRGAGPNSYQWEVTDRSGNLHYFGATPSGRLTKLPGEGPIFRWHLESVEDVHSNRVLFLYDRDTAPTVGPNGEPGEPWVQIYPKTILWTEHHTGPQVNLRPYYRVEFVRENTRADVMSNARAGFDVRTRALLTSVVVKAGFDGEQIVRSYRLGYITGDYGKSLLGSIAMFGLGGEGIAPPLYQHTFEYHSIRDPMGAYRLEPPRLVAPIANIGAGPGPALTTPLHHAATNSGGGHGYGGIGDPFFLVSGTVDVNIGGASQHTDVAMTDITGDGLVDILRTNGQYWDSQLLAPGAANLLRFSDNTLGPIVGDISRDNSLFVGLGANARVIWGASAAGFGGSLNWSAEDRVLADVDGDGRVDIVNGPVEHLGQPALAVRRNPFSFSPARRTFGTPIANSNETEPDYFLQGIVAHPVTSRGFRPDGPAANLETYAIAPLVRWTSPYTGTIKLNGAIHRRGVNAQVPQDGVRARIYLVTDFDADGNRLPTAQTSLLWSKEISVSGGDCEPTLPNSCGNAGITLANINNTDRLYFIVDPMDNPTGDEVNWDPQIQFTQYGPCRCIPLQGTQQCEVPASCTSQPPIGSESFSRTTDFRTADCNTTSWVIGAGGNARVRGSVTLAAGTPATIRVYRRRTVLPPDWPIPRDQPLTPALIQALFQHQPRPTVTLDVISERQVMGGLVNINTPVFVAQNDQVIVHIQLDRTTDPAAIQQSGFSLNYDQYCIQGAGATEDCYTLGVCRVVQPLNIGSPHGTPRTCKLVAVGAAPEHDEIPESLVRQNGIAAVGFIPLINDGTLNHTLRGYWHGWSVGEWNKGADFDETLFASAFDLDARDILTRLSEVPPQAIPGPRWGVVSAQPNGFVLDGITGPRQISVPAWRGAGYDSYQTATLLKPSWSAPFRRTPTGVWEPVDFSTFTAGRAPSLRLHGSASEGATVSIGAGANVAIGESVSDLEFFDFNGDRLPDSVHAPTTFAGVDNPGLLTGSLQEQHAQAFTPLRPLGMQFPNIRHSFDYTVEGSWGFGSAPAGLIQNLRLDGVVNEVLAATPTFSTANNRSSTDIDFLDINGDGLPDHVRIRDVIDPQFGKHYTEMDVQLNLGHTLGRVTTTRLSWTAEPGQTDFARGLTTTIAHTRTQGIGIWHIGGSHVTTKRTVLNMMLDITGDGLPDRIESRGDGGAMIVWPNLGDRFGEPQEWQTDPWDVAATSLGSDTGLEYSEGESWSASASAPGRIPLGVVGLSFGAGGQFSRNDAQKRVEFTDVNGDGRLDHVAQATNGARLYARMNPSGPSNLLRVIRSPIGGQTELTYERTGNYAQTAPGSRVDMQHSQFVLARVTVSDGNGVGIQHVRTQSMKYLNGFYDRAERENYGFGEVQILREDNARVTLRFHTDDYYRKGMLRETILSRDPSNAGLNRDDQQFIWSRTVSEYAATPMDVLQNRASFYPSKTRDTQFFYDGQVLNSAAFIKQTTVGYFYDTSGRLERTETENDEDTLTSNDDVVTTISYCEDDARNVHRPRVVTVKDSADNILRQRTSSYDQHCILVAMEDRHTGGINPANGQPYSGGLNENPRTEYEHDEFGNIKKVTDVTGFYRAYTYDGVTRTYRETVIDSFHYTSITGWDLRWGIVNGVTDMNNQSTHFEFDRYGRMIEAYGPTDLAASPTISFEYVLRTGGMPDGLSYAITHHKDMQHPADPIDTITFVDGFGRVVQTKVDAEVADVAGTPRAGRVLSGQVEYDAMGRVTQQYQPYFEPLAEPFTRTSVFAVGTPTVMTYDPLNRVTRVRAPDGTVSTTAYAGLSFDGITRMAATVTDALGRTGTTYHLLDGSVVATQQHNIVTQPNGISAPRDLVTKYFYDPLGRLTRTIDADVHATTAEYDSLDNMVRLESPDMGISEWRFTRSGDLESRETANLHALGQRITYERNYHRLSRVVYPTTAATELFYGEPGEANNRAGRLMRRVDAAGTTELEYGPLGEVLRSQQHLVAAGTSPGIDTDMRFAFDPFGRLQTVLYPDGELLRYSYDLGGNLQAIRGTPSGRPERTYVDRIAYNEFGQRANIRYGNGVETNYAYDPQMRRLTNTVSKSNAVGTFQSLQYAYNRVGNITRIDNNLPQPIGIAGNGFQKFEYDELDQLVSATGVHRMQAANPARRDIRGYSLAMAYDGIGNILRKTQSDVLNPAVGPAAQVQATSYDFEYAYGGTRPHAATVIGNRRIVYDAGGNQIEQQTLAGATLRTQTWDEEERLLSVQDGEGSPVTFVYNADGTRTHRVSASGTTVYANQYWTVRNGSEITKHVFAGTQRISSVVGAVNGDVPGVSERRLWYHSDHLQTTQFVTGASGNVEEHYESFPFGEPWVEQSSVSAAQRTAYRFTGKEYDAETGLYYFGARYYDPRTSQWESGDPALGMNVNAQNRWVFTYGNNSPVRMVDPDGRQSRNAESAPPPPQTPRAADYVSTDPVDYIPMVGTWRQMYRAAMENEPVFVIWAGLFAADTAGTILGVSEAIHAVRFFRAAAPAVVRTVVTAQGGTRTATATMARAAERPAAATTTAARPAQTEAAAASGTITTPSAEPAVGRSAASSENVAAGAPSPTVGNSRPQRVSRPLTREDLGITSETAEVQGTLTVSGDTATARIEYIGGSLGREGIRALDNIEETARSTGASRLRVETTPIIEQTGILRRYLQRRGFNSRSNGTMWRDSRL